MRRGCVHTHILHHVTDKCHPCGFGTYLRDHLLNHLRGCTKLGSSYLLELIGILRLSQVRLDRSSLPRPLRSDTPKDIRIIGIADHILGSMREVQAEDVARRPFRSSAADNPDLSGYRNIGDRAGARGLERVFEDHLRGSRGEIRSRVDVEQERRIDPAPGLDLNTTIDISLQSRIQAILSPEFGLTKVQAFHHNKYILPGRSLNSATVVIEVETGDILSMVSMPTRAMGLEKDAAWQARENPWVNRPVEAIYPPGSIIKPLVLAAAVTEGEHNLDNPIQCTGHFLPNRKDIARCWIYRDRWGFATHGPLLAEDAIGRSCNIFFYTLADRIGISDVRIG